MLNPVAEIMPDRCTPEYERVIAKMGPLLPYARARTLLSEFLPLGDVPAAETTRRRTVRVGARLEQQALANRPTAPAIETRAIALSIDGGHVRSVRSYQVRSFEVMLAQVSNDDGKQVVLSSMSAEADRQQDQLRGVLQVLGATPTTPVTILSDGAEGPRSLGEAASLGPDPSCAGLVPSFDANPARRAGGQGLARRLGEGSQGRCRPRRDDWANPVAALAWTGRARSRSHRRNRRVAGCHRQISFAGDIGRTESNASSGRTGNLCMRAGQSYHRLCDGQAPQGANLHGGHRKHSAMAATPPDERPAADALDATRCAFDAQGPICGDERYT